MSEHKNETLHTEPIPTPLTVDYPLRKIEEIARDQAYLMEAIAALSKNEDGQAACKIVMARETTNQKLIAFYEKVYDELSGNALHRDGRAAIAAELLSILKDPNGDASQKESAADVLRKYMQVL